MSTTELQVWIAIVGSLVTIAVSVGGLINYQSRRDRATAVGTAFRDVIDGLASTDPTRRMAAAILMRRFFDRRSEQGAARKAYAKEAVAVIAGILRDCQTGVTQKVLADGLRYAPTLAEADLQQCNLAKAYLGSKSRRTCVDLTEADLFGADLTGASLKNAAAPRAVFYRATLNGTVLAGADVREADFREAHLKDANFDNALLEGARFKGAVDVPVEVADRLDADGLVATSIDAPR